MENTNITPAIVAVCGSKNSGKTTLIEAVLPHLARAGLNVAVIKHHGHKLDPDVRGTDTYRFNHNGAYGTVITDDDCFMLVKYGRTDERALMRYFPEADLILLEGYKESGWPKIEMRRDAAVSVCDTKTLIAVVTDGIVPERDIPVFAYADSAGVAGFLIARQRSAASE
ncbi:MAG: molybdopterin-guanine dinucleotide biosynthesis protein B [Clostridiales Family XIII bacterium]|jgi:molybdopterin-guanine dinucleotide biosynthesis protein B|nr:molybdopterin-guanine dinucleotide biosynthesis protein B [Clostridiales Family XIII bacterium]